MRMTARSVSGSSPTKVAPEDAAIGQRDFHFARAVDDVAVGQDVAVGRDDKAGAAAAGIGPPRRSRLGGGRGC